MHTLRCQVCFAFEHYWLQRSVSFRGVPQPGLAIGGEVVDPLCMGCNGFDIREYLASSLFTCHAVLP